MDNNTRPIDNFSTSVELTKSPAEVFKCIQEVSQWWSRDLSGHSRNVGDEFVIDHPGQHYSRQLVTEAVPAKKIVWSVTESRLNWLDGNKEEWTGTKMIFHLKASGAGCVLEFTHEGLKPGIECYALCEKGWKLIITEWLKHYVTTGKASPGIEEAQAIRNRALNELESEKQSYHHTFSVTAGVEEAFQKISRIDQWWKRDFEGSAAALQNTFRIPFGDPSFVDGVVKEWSPFSKVVWQVSDCYLHWFADKQEWKGTEMIFRLEEIENGTKIEFRHKGLLPHLECYHVCENGWEGHLRTLAAFIDGGKGLSD